MIAKHYACRFIPLGWENVFNCNIDSVSVRYVKCGRSVHKRVLYVQV